MCRHESSLEVNVFRNARVAFKIVSVFLRAAFRGQEFWLFAGGVGIHLPSTRPQAFSDQTRCVPVSLPGKHSTFQTWAKTSNQNKLVHHTRITQSSSWSALHRKCGKLPFFFLEQWFLWVHILFALFLRKSNLQARSTSHVKGNTFSMFLRPQEFNVTQSKLDHRLCTGA